MQPHTRLRLDHWALGLSGLQLGMVPWENLRPDLEDPVLTFLLQLLHVPQLLHVMGVTEPELHAHKGLPPLQAQLVPGFGPGQQVGNGALCQAQDTLPEQPLPWGQGRKATCYPRLGRGTLRRDKKWGRWRGRT